MRMFFISILLCIASICSAETIDTNNVSVVLGLVEKPNTLVLFDMDDTLTDSTITLGSGASRAYLKQAVSDYERQHGKKWQGNLYDQLTYQIAKKVPVRLVEPDILRVVTTLQDENQPVFVLTARGESEWYSSAIPGIDSLTLGQLSSVGLDFSASKVPPELAVKPRSYFQEGILYSGAFKKGPFLADLLKESGYRPVKVIFIDDKLDQVESVKTAMEQMHIPFEGVWYRRAAQDHSHFDPIVAMIQLRELVLHDRIVSDQEAVRLKEQEGDTDPEALLSELIDQQ